MRRGDANRAVLDLESGAVHRRSAMHKHYSDATGIAMVVAAVAAYLFGPDYNKHRLFFELPQDTLNIVHWM